MQKLLEPLNHAPAPAADGIRIALRHSPLNADETGLRAQTETGTPLARACAMDVLAFQRRASVADELLRALLANDDETIRALACSSLARWRLKWRPEELQQILESSNKPELRRAALEASARIALPGLIDVCRRLGLRDTEPIAEATESLGVIGGQAEVGHLATALRRPELAHAALGDADGMPVILAGLREARTAHAAAAAFLRITFASSVEGVTRLARRLI